MRNTLVVALLLGLMALPVAAERKNASPLVKADPGVAPCLERCEGDFSYCEAQPQATSALCPQSRRLCIQRCDPAGLASATLRSLRQTPDELRRRPTNPPSPHQRCRQACQDRHVVCAGQNEIAACEGGTQACYARCDARP